MSATVNLVSETVTDDDAFAMAHKMAEPITYPICRDHIREAHQCRATALGRRLQREGYAARAHQGSVQTDAPADWTQEYLEQIDDQRTVG